ncbi:MAG: DNA polymerase III subunit delta [Candidatus Delongbacteria bacterium]|nr:DNA polymerase III subunit delta [Candidatus Delongbacteria bacterium]MBN2833967.1 DNA polymerase III subunit delta [Candidatus Delongbacteria bacterium]
MAKKRAITEKEINNETLFFIYGDEKYLIDELITKILDTHIPEDLRVFNYDYFSEENSNAEAISNALHATPMMSDKKIVHITSVEKLSVSILDIIDLFLSKNIDSTILILSGGKPDLRKKFFKNLSTKAITVQFDPLNEKSLSDWILTYVKSNNRSMTREALMLFLSTVSSNIKYIKSELDKLFIFYDGNTIDENVVADLLGVSKEFNLFKLVENVCKRDFKNSVYITDQLLKSKENKTEPIAINLYLARIFTSAFKISSESRKSGKSIENSAASLGYNNPWLHRDFIECAKNYSLKELGKTLRYFLECDIKLKSSYQNGSTSIMILLKKVITESDNKDVDYLVFFNKLNGEN